MLCSLRNCWMRSRTAILSLVLALLLAFWQPDADNGNPENAPEEVSFIQGKVTTIYSVQTGAAQVSAGYVNDMEVGSSVKAETQVVPLPSISKDAEKNSRITSRFVLKPRSIGPSVKFPKEPKEVSNGVSISFVLVFIAGIFVGIAATISVQAMMKPQEGQHTSPVSSPHAKAAAEKLSEDDIEMSYTGTFNIELFWPRAASLCLLLVLQSGSSIILQFFNTLLEEYTSLVYYFTMLVGLGGNAGVQSVVIAVRRLAMGEPVSPAEQGSIGIRLALILAPLAFLRAFIQGTEVSICMVIGVAAAIICTFATVFGTSLTVALKNFDFDPAHASAAIQVLMDIIGLAIVCAIATLAIRLHLLNDPQ